MVQNLRNFAVICVLIYFECDNLENICDSHQYLRAQLSVVSGIVISKLQNSLYHKLFYHLLILHLSVQEYNYFVYWPYFLLDEPKEVGVGLGYVFQHEKNLLKHLCVYLCFFEALFNFLNHDSIVVPENICYQLCIIDGK